MKTTFKCYFWGGVVCAIILLWAHLFELNTNQAFVPYMKDLFYPPIFIFLYMNAMGVFLALLEGLLGLFNGGKSIWYGGSIWNS